MAISPNDLKEHNVQMGALLFQRDTLFTQIDSLYNTSLTLSVDDSNLEVFKIRMEHLETTYQSFSQTNCEIVKLTYLIEDDNKLEIISKAKSMLVDVDTKYFHLLSVYKQFCPQEIKTSTTTKCESVTLGNACSVKLPHIELPTFDGCLKDWPSFKDCFTSLIHDNQTLSPIHKFQYLLSSTKGDVHSLVRTLPLTENNYSIIWEKLVSRYDNKRLLATHYLEEIINIDPITVESVPKLRFLVDTVAENLQALNKIDFPDSLGNFIIFHLLCKKLDKRSRQMFEEKFAQYEFPTLTNLQDFLNNHCKALEASRDNENKPIKSIGSTGKSTTNTPQGKYVTPFSKSFVSSTNMAATQSNPVCIYCSQSHIVFKCPSFCNLSPNQRKEFVKSKRICFNCLSNLHMLNGCTSNKTCMKCGKRHHTYLHIDNKQSKTNELKSDSVNRVSFNDGQTKQNKVSDTNPQVTKPSSFTGISSMPVENQSFTLLGTVKMSVQDFTGKYQVVRGLVDPGSQLSFITESCVRKLGLPRQKYHLPVMGLSQTHVSNTKGLVHCVLKPAYTNQQCIQAKAVILDKITSSLPSCNLSPDIRNQFQHLHLADDEFDKPGPIDFLLGADLYPLIFDGGRINTSPGCPTPFHSIFGWVLIGEITNSSLNSSNHISHITTSHFCISDNSFDLEKQLKQFWELEELPKVHHNNPDDQFCEEHFVKTHTRSSIDGRYIVKLPFSEESHELGNSYNNAISRFHSLEKRLESHLDFRNCYNAFMNEYESLGHMKQINPLTDTSKYFIPHHGIFKDSTSTKFRTVFDASASSSNGKSLNNILLPGPKLQRDIVEILSSFRFHAVAFTADIAKMYRQIGIHSDHQPYQTILWRESPDVPIRQYALTTVTYGVTSSPFLAIRTIHQLVKDEGSSFPLAINPVMNDMYVDDLLTGAPTIDEALKLKYEIVELLKRGCFELKKWSSNSKEFLSTVSPTDQVLPSAFTTDDNSMIKILGVKWCPTIDIFTYEVQSIKIVPTKRNMLSHIARIFDILGWIAPVVIFAKILIQRIWLLGIDWDEHVPEDIQKEWFKFTSELQVLSDIKIPRYVLSNNFKELSIHGFCDASMKAFAAVTYLRVVHSDFSVSIHLFMAKSKVSPLKTVSLPRLELCGAVLLAKLLEYCKNIIKCRLNTIPQTFAWADSTIALSWIRTPPHLLKTFIANRVSIIQEKTNPSDWYHVPSENNPADCASRGLYPSQLITHSLWWSAPEWLYEPSEHWPKQNEYVPFNQLPEVKEKSVMSNFSSLEQTDFSILERFSSLDRLKRVTALCFRFINNCKSHGNKTTPLNVSEVNSALLFWIKRTQEHFFSESLTNIKAKRHVKGPLSKLDPFIDSLGVLRVGGRLHNSNLPYEAKHPILLPKRGHLTNLIVDHYHQMYLHVGPRTLQSILCRRFWILSSRNVIRKRIHQCIKCKRLNPVSPQPMMAPLPAARLQCNRPFIQVGVDFGGPFSTKTHKGKRPLILKSYLCLFVCFTTKAVHLEVVSSLSTDDFIAALSRFIARRGLCSDIYSDNATNFVGARNYLKEVSSFLKQSSEKIQQFCVSKEINWHFIPSSAPHFGGLWEAGIKSTKYHLKRLVGERILTFEELSTLFCQIESILNSRPLCALSTDPNEIEVLTPGHFLIGDCMLSAPQEDVTTLPLNRLSRWQLIQQSFQHFWQRWSQEYLHTLQQRSKWTKKVPNISVGDLVVLKEQNLPPLQWPLARVLEVHVGKDDIARVASLKLKSGNIVNRPIIKICPLLSCQES